MSIRIMPGESVAVVGASGSGKSTILKLVTRLYDATGGRVKVNCLAGSTGTPASAVVGCPFAGAHRPWSARSTLVPTPKPQPRPSTETHTTHTEIGSTRHRLTCHSFYPHTHDAMFIHRVWHGHNVQMGDTFPLCIYLYQPACHRRLLVHLSSHAVVVHATSQHVHACKLLLINTNLWCLPATSKSTLLSCCSDV